MIGQTTHLLGITSRYPYGYQESYVETELEELKQYFGRVTLVPVRPPDGVRRSVPENILVLSWPLFDVEIFARAVAALLTRPIQCASAIAALLASRDPGKTKNLAVMLKGLALGQWAREHGVTHVHRWDIYEKNAFNAESGAAFRVDCVFAGRARDLGRWYRDGKVDVVALPARADGAVASASGVHADPYGARARAARAYERVRARHDYSHGALA